MTLSQTLLLIHSIIYANNANSASNTVEFTFWTSSNDLLAFQFRRNFTNITEALQTANDIIFTPHMYIVSGSNWGCDDVSLPCKKQCSNSGRYCATDPENDLSIGIDGIDVVQENLRSLCVWEYANTTGTGFMLWWNYANLWDEKCGIVDNKENHNFNEYCSLSQMDELDPTEGLRKFVTNCVSASGGYGYTDGENTMLSKEMNLQYDSGIHSFPIIQIDDSMLFDSTSIDCPLPITTDSCTIFKSICNSFVTGSQPSVCLYGTCFGSNTTNPCGYCLDPKLSSFNTFGMDCKGICDGDYMMDSCTQCLLSSDAQWNICETTTTPSPTLSWFGALLTFPSVIDGTLYNQSFFVAPSLFGYQGYGETGTVEGVLILPSNESYHFECLDSHEPLGSNPYIHFIRDSDIHNITDYIVVIDRGMCLWVDKTEHAQSMGASAVIICDSKDENLFTMWPPTHWVDDIHIPSVLLSNEDCMLLMRTIGVVNWNPMTATNMKYPSSANMDWTIATIEWGLPYGDCANADRDCNGICYGNDVIDACGKCLPIFSPDFNECIRCNAFACDGSCSIALKEDECGKCIVESDPSWNECIGCDGVPYSGKSVNPCAICIVSSQSDFSTYGMDCNGVCYGDYGYDACGICRSTTDTDWNDCIGCDGVSYSNREYNVCGRCVDKTDPNFDDYGKDCTGMCASVPHDTHYVDKCGDCLQPSDPLWNACVSAGTPEPHYKCIDKRETAESYDFTLSIAINCTLSAYIVDITYSAYKGNWFGIVLNDSMIGSAWVYTTGKAAEESREPGLYWYFIHNHSSSGVEFYDYDWYEISTEEYDGSIRVKYGISDEALAEEPDVVFKWAYGTVENDLTLAYHHENIASDVGVISFNASKQAKETMMETTEKTSDVSHKAETKDTKGHSDKKVGMITILLIVIGVLVLVLCLCAAYVYYTKCTKPQNEHLNYVRNIQMDLEDEGRMTVEGVRDVGMKEKEIVVDSDRTTALAQTTGL